MTTKVNVLIDGGFFGSASKKPTREIPNQLMLLRSLRMLWPSFAVKQMGKL